MQLKALLRDINVMAINKGQMWPICLEQEIELVTLDSKKAHKGTIFVASKGATPLSRDGHDFIRETEQQGVSAIIVENHRHIPPGSDVPIFSANNSRRIAAHLSERLHNYPSKALDVCAVTGTNGKTTATFLTAAIMTQAGKKSAVLGTLGVGTTSNLKSFGFTTPEAEILSCLLHELCQDGFQHLTMEVSSHALSTHRADGLSFKAAAFTNLSVDHLDFHGDMENYQKAKNRLFTELLARDCPAILPEAHSLIPELSGQNRSFLTWGFSPNADIRAEDVKCNIDGLSFSLAMDQHRREITTQFFGHYNIENMLCAAGLAHASGASIDQIADGLALALPPPARLERVAVPKMHSKPAVFVDFAHTPDALERMLKSLREITKGRLIVVFGCAGDRDKSKRPQMGNIASRLADCIVITSDNPRHEDPNEIIGEVFEGVETNRRHSCNIVPNRHEAINRSIKAATTNDVIVIAGKGHETTQQIGDQFFPFHDLSVAKFALEEWHL